MKKIRVMIVEDSPVIGALLAYSIGRDPRLEVCAVSTTAEDALQALETLSPDAIAMDIRLPGMDGLEATRRIMSSRPVPIVVVAASWEAGKWNTLAMQALEAGALSILEKPVATTNASYESLAERLCTQLVIMSEVKLVRRRGNGRSHPAPGDIPTSPSNAGRYRMLGIACSTGGPGALVELLTGLGPAFPLPILLVQHITGSFVEGFASWLDGVSPFSAMVVKSGCVPTAGTLHLAPAERHLRLDGGELHLHDGAPVSFQRPSGTVLFQSMARDLGADAMGLLLTGMGDDGASGLLDIRRSGGYTIAEDESTAVVYGMPRAAVKLGAVCESLPLPKIAERVLGLVSCPSR